MRSSHQHATGALRLGATRCASGEVVLPGALPNIVTAAQWPGVRLAALIAAEIIVGTSGIGFLMFDARRAGSVVEIILA